MGITYKDSGVDKEAGYTLVEKAKNLAKNTHNSRVLNGIGSFAALYDMQGYQSPVLVSGTDGVGTKLAVAFQQNRYDTVGIDCVAMCVNDILCHGAKPLFFLDYIGCGHLVPEQAAELVAGIAEGCQQSGCALIGGETAEMPGFYKPGDYDIAGFTVGVVERDDIVDGRSIAVGDQVIGLASSGVHSNGFSLVRRLFPGLTETVDGKPVGDILLTPTRIYVPSILAVLAQYPIKGMAHITGGGLIENIPRTLPQGLSASIDKSAIPRQPIFEAIAKKGVAENEMWETFNMGVGFVIIVSQSHADDVMRMLNEQGEVAFLCGEITANDKHPIVIK